MRLRYTGPNPVTFVGAGLEVEPGGEFVVPDDDAGGYLAHPHIEEINEAAPVPPRSVSRPRGKQAPGPIAAGDADAASSTPVAEVEADGVSVDH